MPKPRNYCAVDGCQSKKTNENLSFFSLPRDEQRRRTWLEIIGRPDLMTTQTKSNCHFVCSLHFEKSMMRNKPQLKADAVPTKLLPNQPSTSNHNISEDCKNESTQTKESFINVLSAQPRPRTQQPSDPFKEYANDSTDEETRDNKEERSSETESDTTITQTAKRNTSNKTLRKNTPYKTPPPKRSRIEPEQFTSDETEQFYEFGKFVAEQLMCLDVEDARIAQEEIKELLKTLKSKKIILCLEEPSTSQVAQVDPFEASDTFEEQVTIKIEPDSVEPSTDLSMPSENLPTSINATKLSLVSTVNVKLEPSIAPAPYVLTPTSTAPKRVFTKQLDDTAGCSERETATRFISTESDTTTGIKKEPTSPRSVIFADCSETKGAARFLSIDQDMNIEVKTEPCDADRSLGNDSNDYTRNPSVGNSRSALIKLEHVSDDEET